MAFLRIEDVHHFLAQIPNFQLQGNSAFNADLNAIQTFCGAIGSPQTQFKSIHIAGSNGKGTCCAMLTSLFISGGYKVGTYTSPHLLKLNERVKINGQNCADEDLITFFSQFEAQINSIKLTYFELLTAFCFWVFAKENVDIAIIEVGLGGRLDATNIIQPLCCGITSISLDHQAILGDSIELIAREKAGFIKPSVPVVIGDLPKEAVIEIERISKLKLAPLTKLSDVDFFTVNAHSFQSDLFPNVTFDLDFEGLINIKNALLCLLILEQVNTLLPITPSQKINALTQTRKLSQFKARFERLHPDLNWYFDGAHNEEAVYWLKQIIKQEKGLEHCVCVCTFMKDKDYPALLNEFSSFKSVYYFDLTTSRSASFSEIQQHAPFCIELNEANLEKELNDLRNDIVIFTGSFYFYSIVDSWISRI